MSDTGLGPKLIYHDQDYRIEHFVPGRPLSIWEMRSPVIMQAVVQALYNMHSRSGISEAIDLIRPLEHSRMGVEIAISEWGPTCIDKIAHIR